MARRSGTEKRRRSKTYSVRLDPAEQERAAALRDRAGLPLSALIRRALFDTPLPRATRRPTVNHQAVAKLLGQLGRIGTNINQLAKQANAGRYQENTIELALRELLELRTACLQALGREPDRNDG